MCAVSQSPLTCPCPLPSNWRRIGTPIEPWKSDSAAARDSRIAILMHSHLHRLSSLSCHSSLSSRPWIPSRLAAPTSACASRFPLALMHSYWLPTLADPDVRMHARTMDTCLNRTDKVLPICPPHPSHLSSQLFITSSRFSHTHFCPHVAAIPVHIRPPRVYLARARRSALLPHPNIPRPSSGGRCFISRSVHVFGFRTLHRIRIRIAPPPHL
ncbi:hypothetical protein C8Q74DRAFT_94744 [Fomes fomentarius]|nr:hypothetical protein C8Q74DRAFT_94744 [Fomes fomentarius]